MASVDRSREFLSACATALKIAQLQLREQRQRGEAVGRDRQDGGDAPAVPEWLADVRPADLQLYQEPRASATGEDGQSGDALALIRDSQTLLRLLDGHLAQLRGLVRRRGHTNDPTLEIQAVLEKFQEGAAEVKEACESLRRAGTAPCDGQRSSSQRRKHYELLSSQLESRAKERTDQLKKELETRSEVLREQNHRRKLLASGGGGGDGNRKGNGAGPRVDGAPGVAGRRTAPTSTAAANAAASQFRSPLFTATSGRTALTKKGSAAYPGYAGYRGAAVHGSQGGYGGYGGYGGAATSEPSSFATGMRQRKQPPSQPASHIQVDSGNEDHDYEDKYNKADGGASVQQQIALRRKNRATHSRQQQARLAEKSIAELGVMVSAAAAGEDWQAWDSTYISFRLRGQSVHFAA